MEVKSRVAKRMVVGLRLGLYSSFESYCKRYGHLPCDKRLKEIFEIALEMYNYE